MWEYHIRTGTLLHNGTFVGTGYSGAGKPTEGFRNNPDKVSVPQKGPIPPGRYRIGNVRRSPTLGPTVMNLDPEAGTNMFGRSLFRIHGDNARNDASHGCIILGPSIRQLIAASTDKVLMVQP